MEFFFFPPSLIYSFNNLFIHLLRLSQPSSSLIFPMAFMLSLLMALVLVSYGPAESLGCYLSQRHMLDARENLRLLAHSKRPASRLERRAESLASPRDEA